MGIKYGVTQPIINLEITYCSIDILFVVNNYGDGNKIGRHATNYKFRNRSFRSDITT